ncbi:hypothetical protein GA0061099_1004351 [Bradyrhizobium yuanmingense]|uniref:HD domain-containing protein n=1 Tax=Bradyrhizobium yuanmingense TaxID=108015 RepID=A0A1C3VPD9_9BRAD|nr:hypothetical protein [Bradyrhizobium yuanmingense]TWI28764.1 hypothetical protein IQ15_02110 [Bradyrhizobium yuanmingense]SCB29641.1 hypothetical protein GA0061099_1004351 [Bradyrhizobium yuanmingense]
MDKPAHRTLAGVVVPDTPIVDAAIEHARQHCAPYLFNHVVRSWLFAARLGQLQNVVHDEEVLAVGTLLHDITLNESFAGPRRFEVEGADLARHFAAERGFDRRRAQLIWDSVALNSTPSIALYKESEVALATAGICFDVIGLQYDVIPAAEVSRIVAEFPRMQIKRQFRRCFCHIASTRPETSYDNFIRDFGERFVEGYSAPSVVDLVDAAPFAE